MPFGNFRRLLTFASEKTKIFFNKEAAKMKGVIKLTREDKQINVSRQCFVEETRNYLEHIQEILKEIVSCVAYADEISITQEHESELAICFKFYENREYYAATNDLKVFDEDAIVANTFFSTVFENFQKKEPC